MPQGLLRVERHADFLSFWTGISYLTKLRPTGVVASAFMLAASIQWVWRCA
ncbi:hypothetical protein ACWGID_38350 [Kribbella sp. NPDC054772]